MGWENANPWKDHELDYLKACHGVVIAADAAKHLNRNATVCYQKMKSMGLYFKTDDPPGNIIWRSSLIPGILASESGLLWDDKIKQLIKPHDSKTSEQYIVLKSKPTSVSKIVYEAFYGPLKEGQLVYRKDKNPSNCDITNLIAMTRARAREVGLWGIRHPIAVFKNGKRIAVYPSSVAAAKAYDVTHKTITMRCEGIEPTRTNKQSVKMQGLEFKYLYAKKQALNRQDLLARKKRTTNDNP